MLDGAGLWSNGVVEGTRVDSWLWSVRLFPSRTAAGAACRAGHVRVNDVRAKPATPVTVGATVHVKDARRERIVVVQQLLTTRVGAPLAVLAYEDHSPPPPAKGPNLNAPTAVRDRGSGRPTKRERRETDQLRGRTGWSSR
ncbi:MAG: RNA-binding S4 domain-containing protein [Propionibacteriaceae bacterium]|jgi:ribosome-associated heat shock protein Hsp15|nr:RNA-binding S4 domain-containing protein [Propionibacteriaceae bacterium]